MTVHCAGSLQSALSPRVRVGLRRTPEPREIGVSRSQICVWPMATSELHHRHEVSMPVQDVTRPRRPDREDSIRRQSRPWMRTHEPNLLAKFATRDNSPVQHWHRGAVARPRVGEAADVLQVYPPRYDRLESTEDLGKSGVGHAISSVFTIPRVVEHSPSKSPRYSRLRGRDHLPGASGSRFPRDLMHFTLPPLYPLPQGFPRLSSGPLKFQGRNRKGLHHVLFLLNRLPHTDFPASSAGHDRQR